MVLTKLNKTQDFYSNKDIVIPIQVISLDCSSGKVLIPNDVYNLSIFIQDS
jgi:hypothetical protein